MALRGVAALSAFTKRTHKNPRLLSISYSLRPRFQLSHQRLKPFSIFQSGPTSGIRAVSEVASNPITPTKEDEESSSPENWRIKMLYDGDCPLCMREVNMLRERNERYGTIKFVDISSEDYSPEENQGLDFETAMGRIHAILSDGTVVTDVEAFRKLYEQVGLGWVYAITKYEPMGKIADAVYGVWAKYRLPMTGRPPLEEILEARRKIKAGEVCKDNNSCKM
ncbi:Thioredoxin-like fold containing protein [Parasponia andersonii]|uniref:Thioredoxin-like fold containing protein n=1 Tax=Parasponia andersonii TaxID=3476 RepID=A0A2P5CJ71_PARAD|nr:Thioredoxin-like fold containing protein [Parasponia andersonii]